MASGPTSRSGWTMTVALLLVCTNAASYEKIADGFCDDWAMAPAGGGQYLVPLAETDPLYNADRIHECMDRCLDAYGEDSPRTPNGMQKVDNQAFYVLDGGAECACSYGSCETTNNHHNGRYKSYRIIQDAVVTTTGGTAITEIPSGVPTTTIPTGLPTPAPTTDTPTFIPTNLPTNDHYTLELRGQDAICDLRGPVLDGTYTPEECSMACDDYTGFSIAKTCETESCECRCCSSGYTYELNYDYNTYTLRHFQYCQREADNHVAESSISTVRSHRLDNTDMMALIFDYPGYMRLVNASFANSGMLLSVSDFNVNEPDKCVLDNTAQLSYSFGSLVSDAGMEFSGYVYEFSLDLTFKYSSHFEPTDTFEEVFVERQAYFGFVAPEVFVLDIKTGTTIPAGQENFYAVDGWRFKADLEEGAKVEVDFQTYVTADHVFSGAESVTSSSDYFTTSAATVVEHPSVDLEQHWTLSMPAAQVCKIGVHEETVTIKLIAQDGYELEVSFTIDLFDDYKPECAHELSNLAVEAKVSTGEDGNAYTLLTSTTPLDMHLDTFLYVRVEFSLGLENYNVHAPQLDTLFDEIDLTHITTKQDGLIKCGSDQDSDECFSELMFRCETCTDAHPHLSKHSNGAYYFRAQFPRDYGDGQGFLVGVNQTSAIDMELDFTFNYKQNTQVRRVLVKTADEPASASGMAELALTLEGPDSEIESMAAKEETLKSSKWWPEISLLVQLLAIVGLLRASYLAYHSQTCCNCLKSGDYYQVELEHDDI